MNSTLTGKAHTVRARVRNDSAMALLRLLSWPYFRRHPAANLLVVTGIALAVAVYASMHLSNQAIEEAFREAADALAGSAQLQVTGGEAGVPESALERVRQTGCVKAAAAVMLRTVATGLNNERGLAILGIDLLEERPFREYRLETKDSEGPNDPLLFLAQPDSVLVTQAFAERNGLISGSALPVWSGREEKKLTVRGMLESHGVARAYHGNLAVMDLYAAQQTFGRRGYFDRIDIAVREGNGVEGCRAAVAQALGPHLKVAPPPSRGSGGETLSTTYLFLVESSALLGILVAMGLVHHAGVTSVARREREIGIVLGLGADVGAIRRMVLIESAALGAVGGALGAVLGTQAAGYLSSVLAGLLDAAWGVQVAVGPAVLEWRWAAVTILTAAACSATAGLLPARNAAATPPIQLMEARPYGPLTTKPSWRLFAAAGTCGAIAVLWQTLDRSPGVLYATLPLACVAIALAARALAPSILRILRLLFAAAWPVEGALAIDSLARTSRRTRGTIMGLGAAIATFIAISGMSNSYAVSFRRWALQIANADFLIHSSTNLAERGKMFPASTLDRLRSVAGVAAVTPVRRLTARVEGRTCRVIGIDFALWRTYGGAEIPASPGGAILSRNFANLSGRRPGERVRIASPDGEFELPVAGIIDDYTDETGTVWLDWKVFCRRFRDDAVELFAVRLKPGAPQARARQDLLQVFDPRAPVLVLDGAEFRRYLDGLVDRWRAASYVQIVAAALIALIGAGSFLMVSIVERRRELGLITVLGATPVQLARCVVVEALGVATAALSLGVPAGMLLESYLLFTLRRSISGFELPWSLDIRLSAALIAAVPAAALLAGLVPIWSLTRMNLVREVERDA
jgi:putative ABC transport system permease protein